MQTSRLLHPVQNSIIDSLPFGTPFGLYKMLSNLQFRLIAPRLNPASSFHFTNCTPQQHFTLLTSLKTQMSHKLKHLLYIH